MFGALPFVFSWGELGELGGIVKPPARVGVFGFFGCGRFLSSLAIRSHARQIGLFVNIGKTCVPHMTPTLRAPFVNNAPRTPARLPWYFIARWLPLGEGCGGVCECVPKRHTTEKMNTRK